VEMAERQIAMVVVAKGDQRRAIAMLGKRGSSHLPSAKARPGRLCPNQLAPRTLILYTTPTKSLHMGTHQYFVLI
jgi:hypothetical protein